jgi:putative hemolysin
VSIRVILGLACIAARFAAAPAAGANGKAAAYCKKQGGTVQVRYPAYGTNTPATQVRLSGAVSFCKFRAQDGSRIYVDLATLYTKQPTLAAVAYLTRPDVGEIPGNVNPASVYCTRLGGTDLYGGVNAAGGGFVSRSDSDDPVVQACIFPDLSIIDSFGLFYNSDGAIRGKDLSTVLRYRPANPPSIFG